MSVSTDDDLFDEFVAMVNQDAHVKQQFVAALRAKDGDRLRQAVRWVVENLIKPGLKALRERAVDVIAATLLPR